MPRATALFCLVSGRLVCRFCRAILHVPETEDADEIDPRGSRHLQTPDDGDGESRETDVGEYV